MISPSWSFADVFALKALQKSMMFTPCWPRAGPTGGAGVALPAGICSFTWPITFFAILSLLYLQEIQFNGCRSAEDRHHDFQCAAIRVDFVDDAGEGRERTVDDLHRLALLK